MLATLTAAGVGLWLLLSSEADQLRYERAFTLRAIAAMEIVYATLMLASALSIRRMRGYLLVLLCVPIVGIALPAALAFAVNVSMEWGGVPHWPVLIPLWIGIPSAVWTTAVLLRQDVREAFT
jgi:hypothetical protein